MSVWAVRLTGSGASVAARLLPRQSASMFDGVRFLGSPSAWLGLLEVYALRPRRMRAFAWPLDAGATVCFAVRCAKVDCES